MPYFEPNIRGGDARSRLSSIWERLAGASDLFLHDATDPIPARYENISVRLILEMQPSASGGTNTHASV